MASIGARRDFHLLARAACKSNYWLLGMLPAGRLAGVLGESAPLSAQQQLAEEEEDNEEEEAATAMQLY